MHAHALIYVSIYSGGAMINSQQNSGATKTGTIQFADTDELLDIRYDNIFKAVFTKDTPESKGALSKLVSALICREVSILSIIANEPPIENARERQIRFDINCKAENEELVNVEMCLNPDPYEPVRLEYHASKLFIG